MGISCGGYPSIRECGCSNYCLCGDLCGCGDISGWFWEVGLDILIYFRHVGNVFKDGVGMDGDGTCGLLLKEMVDAGELGGCGCVGCVWVGCF